MDDQLTAAAVGIVLLIAVFNVSSFYLANRTVEPFSELGILGPNQKIADYPTRVFTGQNFTLYLYVGNHEGKVTYYLVLTKVGNMSSLSNDNVTLSVPAIASYGMVLLNNQTYLKPITLNISHPGTNVKLVFELWVYQANLSSFIYDHRQNQLYLNVTGSSI
ncbi:MAG: DUF1616 domain-containing protein [Thaumarchaeota archaeon]|nr:DUF1616 domain-containing protein [Nitrososphaerota archaeon]